MAKIRFTVGTLLQVFLIAGFLGLVLESISYSLDIGGCSGDGMEKKWSFDAINNPEGECFKHKGSINPLAIIPGSIMNGLIYGTGAIMLLVLNNYMGDKIPIYVKVVIFGLIAGFLELIVGLISNSKYDQWDYRKNRFNIKGQTDLAHIIAWGILSSLFIFLLIPKLVPTMQKINEWGSKNVVNKCIVVGFIVVGLIMTYSTEKSYKKGNTPYVVQFFDLLEPPFPPKRSCCKSTPA